DELDELVRHAERSKDWVPLADALERRASIVTDDAGKLATLQKLGSVYSEHLNDMQSSVRSWRRVLELSPGHSRALRVLREAYLASADYDGLEQLYAAQKDWEGLADVLSNAADRAKEPAARIELSYRAAQVLEERLGQPDRAFRSYERILLVDPNDVRAAKALIPLYEKDEKWSRLPALYELLLSQATEPEEKIGLLTRLVEVTGRRLGDRRAAAAYARRAYEIEPTSVSTLELFEAASRAGGGRVGGVRGDALGAARARVGESARFPEPGGAGAQEGQEAQAAGRAGGCSREGRRESRPARARAQARARLRRRARARRRRG